MRRATLYLPSLRLPPAASFTVQSMALPLVVAIVSLGILVIHAERYLPFLSDDSLITLRYAHRLLEGHGLTWTEGRPVEGYSNLLWLLLVALLGFFDVELIRAARLLGFLCGGLALGAFVHRYATRSFAKALPMVCGALTFALAAPVAVWTIGGLEQPLIGALLAWAVVCSFRVLDGDAGEASQRRFTWMASLCLALLCITRPDGALFTASTLLALLLAKGFRRAGFRAALRLASLPALFVLGQLCFRLAYYGEWLPNTAFAKLSFSWLHLQQGLRYVGSGLVSLSPLVEIALLVGLLAVLGVFKVDSLRRARVGLLLLHGAVWSVYLAAIGGDVFPAFRHMTPIVVLMAFLIAEGLAWYAPERRSTLARALLVGCLAVAFTAGALQQGRHPENRRALHERWEWIGRSVGLTLKQGFGAQQPLVAVTAAGSIPYWSDLPAIDMLGLNDHHIARHRSRRFGEGWLGHELWDGDYVLRRRPDLIVFHVGSQESGFLEGRKFQAEAEFRAHYTPVRFEAPAPSPYRFVAWVRRDSEKIGIRRSSAGVVLPAYLLNGNEESFARLDANDAFVVSVSINAPAQLPSLALEPGRWRLEADANWQVYAHVRLAGEGGATLFAGKLPGRFTLRGKERRNVALSFTAPPALQVEIREARLTRSVRAKTRPAEDGER